jgi:hypothetical protein
VTNGFSLLEREEIDEKTGKSIVTGMLRRGIVISEVIISYSLQ